MLSIDQVYLIEYLLSLFQTKAMLSFHAAAFLLIEVKAHPDI